MPASGLGMITIVIALMTIVRPALAIGDDPAATVYRLTEAAAFQEGCFDPCLCPIGGELPVRGTLLVAPPVPGDVVDFFEVTEVNWVVGNPGETTHRITGGGSYRVTNYGGDVLQALDLDLSIDGGESQFFFSDFVPLVDNAPVIDVTVSMNGLYCYDIAIRVSAAPVAAREILDYGLIGGSTYQQGCFDPCDCILELPVPMRGRFDLVELYDAGTWTEYAVIRALFGVRGSGAADAMLNTYQGAGRYIMIQGFAGPLQAMELALTTPAGGSLEFDSGLRTVDVPFPDIDIVLSMNDMVCFDRILTLRARRPAHVMPLPGAFLPGAGATARDR